ncbi:MAG: hypothetical protein JST70_01780 [Bacteroidetes bacterium]|nr:hypothetical protein [Bacteroidota bacterium]
MMTKEQIGQVINKDFPGVYAPTTEPTKLIFEDGRELVGYFEHTEDSTRLEKENKFTFVQFGEDNKNYRATRDSKYVTVINGNELKGIEYPSYSSVLMKRLTRIQDVLKEHDWTTFKNQWVESINNLFSQIMYKWLQEFESAKLMTFSIIPVRRYESNIGEYLTTTLEIALIQEKVIVFEPIAAITSEFDGRVDFYMVGNVYKKVSLLRNVKEKETTWILAKSYNQADYLPLTKELLLKQIAEWLQ